MESTEDRTLQRLRITTRTKLLKLADLDLRSAPDELEFLLTQELDRRGIDPLTLKERPIEPGPAAPAPAAQPVEARR